MGGFDAHTNTHTQRYKYMCICIPRLLYRNAIFENIKDIYMKLKDSFSTVSLKINYLPYMQRGINTLKHAVSL